MDLIEYRAVIKFFVKEVYGDSSPSFSRIKKWAAEFKRGRTSLEDDPREDVQKVHHHQKSLNKCTIWYWMTDG